LWRRGSEQNDVRHGIYCRGATEFGETGVYLMFEERAEELSDNVRSVGFDLDALVAGNKIVLDHIQIERTETDVTGEYDLEGLFIRLGHAVQAVEAMKSGLDDYIIKSPRHYARLAAAVRKSLRYSEAQRRADELQVRVNSLLTQLNIGVYRADRNGRLIDSNPAFLKLLGVDDIEQAQAIYQTHFTLRAATTGRASVREIQLSSQDGLRWFSLKEAAADTEENGTVTEGLLQEITARKSAEAQKEALLKEREQLLANEQNLRGEAERLLHVKDEFLSTVSHELRTPLNSISGWAHLLLKDAIDGPSTKAALETIMRNVRAQAQIIDDLTDVSAIITGKLRLDLQDVDVGRLLKSVLEALQPAAQSKNIQLGEYRLPEHPLIMQAIQRDCSRSSGTWSPMRSNLRKRMATFRRGRCAMTIGS
jgi:signal transduction histidine kinase